MEITLLANKKFLLFHSWGEVHNYIDNNLAMYDKTKILNNQYKQFKLTII